MLSQLWRIWNALVADSESDVGGTRLAVWTTDILRMMLGVVGIAAGLLLAGALAGIFRWGDISPVFILLSLVLLGWWGARRGGWRWARFFPALLCFCLATYFSVTASFTLPSLFFALAVLLAGMLLNHIFQWITPVLSILVLFAVSLSQGQASFVAHLGNTLTNSFLLIGVSLLQWYYNTQLRGLVSDYKFVNRVLSEEVDNRRSTEARLQEQEKQYRRLADNTTDLICEITLDGSIRYASPSYQTTLGLSPEALLGTNAFDLVHPEDRPAAWQLASENAAVGSTGKMQLRCRNAEGDYLYFEVVGTPLYGEAGEPQGFVVSSRDISQQKQAEAANHAAEINFSHIINFLPLGLHMYTLDADGRLILSGYNPAADRILGISHAKLIGKTILEAFPGLAATEIPDQYAHIARENVTYNTSQLAYQDHQILNGIFEVHAFQISPGKMVTVFADISERLQAEAALRLSEEKFSKAFLISPDAININRLSDGLYIDINQGFTEITGYTCEDVLGKTSLELNIWADPADRERLARGLRANGIVENLEAQFRFKDGSIHTGLMSARILEINQEQCILSFTRNLTERKQRELELRTAHARLEEAYEATLQGWVRALELREHETADHSRRVVELTLALSEKLGINQDSLADIQRGALLHDIGKLGVPDNILLKPGQLTAEEWIIMRYHPRYAYELLEQIPYLAPSMDIPYCHHERWDGAGYPRGIAGEDIPLPARIFTVVDVYDALLSDRPYRPAWSKRDVVRYLREQKGQQFDPKIVDCFLEMI